MNNIDLKDMKLVFKDVNKEYYLKCGESGGELIYTKCVWCGTVKFYRRGGLNSLLNDKNVINNKRANSCHSCIYVFNLKVKDKESFKVMLSRVRSYLNKKGDLSLVNNLIYINIQKPLTIIFLEIFKKKLDILKFINSDEYSFYIHLDNLYNLTIEDFELRKMEDIQFKSTVSKKIHLIDFEDKRKCSSNLFSTYLKNRNLDKKDFIRHNNSKTFKKTYTLIEWNWNYIGEDILIKDKILRREI